jgi:hypothetical protein
MSGGRPKLGAVFRGEALPDRTAGLAGLLPAVPPPPAAQTDDEPLAVAATSAPAVDPVATDTAKPEPSTSTRRRVGERTLSLALAPAPAPAPSEPAGASTKSDQVASSGSRKAKRAPAESAPATDLVSEPAEDPSTIKMVPANIDLSIHADLRQFATRNELSFATVVLRAIEANAETLSTMWTTPRASTKTGLFGATAQRSGNRRAEPAVQIQLRIPLSDAQVLNDLVDAWQAPSRGAMITEALRLFVPTATPAS